MNLAKCELVYCGALSLIIVCIMPYLVMFVLMCLMMVSDLVSLYSGTTSMKLEK